MPNSSKMDKDLKRYYIVTVIDLITWIVAVIWAFLIRGSENMFPFYLLCIETFIGYSAPRKFRTFSKKVPGIFFKNHSRFFESSLRLLIFTIVMFSVLFLLIFG